MIRGTNAVFFRALGEDAGMERSLQSTMVARTVLETNANQLTETFQERSKIGRAKMCHTPRSTTTAPGMGRRWGIRVTFGSKAPPTLDTLAVWATRHASF